MADPNILKKIEKYRQQMRNIEGKERFTLFDKLRIKALMKKSRQQMDLLKRSEIEDVEFNKLLTREIMDLKEVFSITDPKTKKQVTEETLLKTPLKENIELFEQILKELEKII